MAETQMWRIDAGHRVCEVAVALFTGGMWGCADGHYETTPMSAVRAWAFRNSVMGAVLAPNESTRAELAAQLAAVTAERDDATNRARFFAGLVSEVVRAVEPRDGEALGDEVRRVVRERDRALAVRDGRTTILSAREALGATDDEGLCDAAQRVTRERDVALGQIGPLLDAHDALVAAARAAGWTGAGATGAELVAWVRRGEREACAARCDAIYTARDDAARRRRTHGSRDTRDEDCARLAGQAQGAAMCAEAMREGGE